MNTSRKTCSTNARQLEMRYSLRKEIYVTWVFIYSCMVASQETRLFRRIMRPTECLRLSFWQERRFGGAQWE